MTKILSVLFLMLCCITYGEELNFLKSTNAGIKVENKISIPTTMYSENKLVFDIGGFVSIEEQKQLHEMLSELRNKLKNTKVVLIYIGANEKVINVYDSIGKYFGKTKENNIILVRNEDRMDIYLAGDIQGNISLYDEIKRIIDLNKGKYSSYFEESNGMLKSMIDNNESITKQIKKPYILKKLLIFIMDNLSGTLVIALIIIMFLGVYNLLSRKISK